MTAGQRGDGDGGEVPAGVPAGVPGGVADPAALMHDWMTLVASELAGMAADREALETWAGLVGLWARGMAGHEPAGHPPGTAAVAAAFGAGGDGGELARLRARVDELERRLAALERPHLERPHLERPHLERPHLERGDAG